MPEPSRIAASGLIRDALHSLPEWVSAQSILVFAPLPSEPDCLPESFAVKRFAFPRISGERLRFYHIADRLDLRVGRHGILEPARGDAVEVTPDCADLIVVPGLAFDAHGGRLGRGGGYYDRLLDGRSARAIAAIGVCFDIQLVDTVPAEPHDVRVSMTVTENRILRA